MPPPGGVLVRNKSRDLMTSSSPSHTVTKATEAKMVAAASAAAASAAAAQASTAGGQFLNLSTWATLPKTGLMIFAAVIQKERKKKRKKERK